DADTLALVFRVRRGPELQTEAAGVDHLGADVVQVEVSQAGVRVPGAGPRVRVTVPGRAGNAAGNFVFDRHPLQTGGRWGPAVDHVVIALRARLDPRGPVAEADVHPRRP